jgi:hypothetical protein
MAEGDDSRVRLLEDTVVQLQDALRKEQEALQNEKQAHRRTMDEVAKLGDSVGRLETSLRSFRSEFDTFRGEFRTFVEKDRLARDKQFAQTMLMDVRARRDREFGHYEKVRNVALGMLLAMDTGIVTNHTMQQAAEQLMLETPGYWLAPVQVALAAWIGDEQGLASRALMDAMAREPNKTSLFFGLVLARQRRDNVTAMWMREYLDRQDPMDLSREFTVVLDAAAQGALGTMASKLAKERCITWLEELRSAENIVQQQALRWQQRMGREQRPISADFTVLPEVSPEWGAVARWLDASTALDRTEYWLRQKFESTAINLSGPRQRAHEVLRKLVGDYDGEEDTLRQQERMWDTVVKKEGDHEAALKILQDDSPAESRSNFFDLLTTIGIAPETVGASETTRQLAIRLADEWITTAAHDFVGVSRADRPKCIKVGIGNWVGELTVDNDEKITRDFGRFVDQEIRDQLKPVTLLRPITFVVLMFLAFAVPLDNLSPYLTHLTSSKPRSLPITWLTATVIGFFLAVYSVIWLWRSRRSLPKRREDVKTRGEDRKRAGQALLLEALAEFRDVFDRWEDELGKESSLVEFIHGQAAHSNLLSMPSIDHVRPEDDRAELLSDTEDQPWSLAAGSYDGAGEGETFAINLPSWDLIPPPHNSG